MQTEHCRPGVKCRLNKIKFCSVGQVVSRKVFITVAQKCHGNFNFITAISISPRQFQLRSRQFQLCHGSFNFTTAISTSFTAISTLSRQFQFHHGNFNFVHGNFNFTTAISILSRQFQLRSRQFQFQFHHRESTKVVKKK